MAFARSKTRDATRSHPEPLLRMSFGDHLNELRRRLIFCILGGLLGVGLCFLYINPIVDFLVHPYLIALGSAGQPQILVWQKPAEKVLIYFGLAFKAGLIVTSPWIIYQLWLFVASGLYPRERRLVYKYIGPSILLFLAGVACFFFLVLPVTLHVLIGFAEESNRPLPTPWPLEKILVHPAPPTGLNPATLPAGDDLKQLIPAVKSDPTTAPADQALIWFNAAESRLKARLGNTVYVLQMTREGALFTAMPTLDDYLSFVGLMALIFGIAFEAPMVIMIIAQLGIATPRTLRKIWKFAYMGTALVAAFVAPTPDITTFLILTVMLISLYELGLFLAWITTRHRKDDLVEDDPLPP